MNIAQMIIQDFEKNIHLFVEKQIIIYMYIAQMPKQDIEEKHTVENQIIMYMYIAQMPKQDFE